MTTAFVLLIAYHIGLGDVGVTPVNFASKESCVAVMQELANTVKFRDDTFRCINTATGEVIKSGK